VNGLIQRLRDAGLNMNYSGYRSGSKQTSSRTASGADVEEEETVQGAPIGALLRTAKV